MFRRSWPKNKELFNNIEQKLIKSFDEKFNILFSTIEKTQKTAASALQRADDNEKYIAQLESDNQSMKTDIQTLIRQHGELIKMIDVQAVQISTLTTRLEHQ